MSKRLSICGTEVLIAFSQLPLGMCEKTCSRAQESKQSPALSRKKRQHLLKKDNEFCAMLTICRHSETWEYVNQAYKKIFVRCVLTGNRNMQMKSSDNYQPAHKVRKRKELQVTQVFIITSVYKHQVLYEYKKSSVLDIRLANETFKCLEIKT